jgi:hypothetical protein
MAVLGKYWQTPSENKRYVIDYTDWLDSVSGELLTSVAFVGVPITPLPVPVPPALNVPLAFAFTLDPTSMKVFVFVSAGDDGVQYKVLVTINTNAGQIKEDEFLVNIKDI